MQSQPETTAPESNKPDPKEEAHNDDTMMALEEFLSRVQRGERVSFDETQSIIERYYRYTPVAFSNGLGEDQVENAPGTNQGSCKIFGFGLLNGLQEKTTLQLFGHYYWDEVINHPQLDNHRNIRNFMRYGWAGIHFSHPPLTPIEQK